MEIFRNSTKDLVNARKGVFALGNFDGVHLGHKEIIAKAISIGEKNNIPSGVLIFEPQVPLKIRSYVSFTLSNSILPSVDSYSLM